MPIQCYPIYKEDDFKGHRRDVPRLVRRVDNSFTRDDESGNANSVNFRIPMNFDTLETKIHKIIYKSKYQYLRQTG